MKSIKIISIWIITLIIFLLFVSSSWGEATLLSIKSGSQEERSWAVLSFDERVIWMGIKQSETEKLTLYFSGIAGELEGSTVTLDEFNQRKIFVKQVNQNPSIFRADITSSRDIPLAVLRNNKYLVVSFNNKRFWDGETSMFEDVSPNPGRLVNVKKVIENDKATTSFEFNGSYDWVGYIRPSVDEAILLIRGAEIYTNNDFSFEKGLLQTVRFFQEESEKVYFKAELQFAPFSSFSIVRRPQSIIIQTSQPQIQEVRQLEAAMVFPELSDFKKEIDDEKQSLEKTVQIPELLEEKNIQPNIEGLNLQEKIEEEKTEEIPWDRKVSFRFRSTPIKDALRLLATSNDLNMVIGDGVKGVVTMNLEGVTLRQAMDMIVHTHDCEYIVEGQIITVKPVAISYTGGRITKVYHLKYADATNVANVIRNVVASDSLVEVFYPEFLNYPVAGKNRRESNKVSVQGIRRSSILVVTDRPEKIREVDRVIKELDKPPVQIMIESKLVELAPYFANKLGIDWDKTLTTVLKRQETLEGGETKDYSFLKLSPDENGEWRMGHLSAEHYTAVLDFLQEKTDSKLISNPRLLAMDNEESSISVGTTVPVPRIQRGFGGQGDMVTFDYKEVNIQLNVTPHVAVEDEITMYINPVIEEITGWVEYLQHRAPITSKRTINSIISVDDGETVVIGGLIKNQRERTLRKVWFLGNLPLLGKLFQHEEYENKQTDLLIFITPTVIQSG